MQSEHCKCGHAVKPLHADESKQDNRKTKRGFTGYIKMVIPAFVFIIIPKCPVCLAGYIALISGVSLSITTATYLRIGLIVLCIVSLVYFITRHARRWFIEQFK